MPKYFIEKPGTDIIQLTGDKAHHIKNVLRMRVGERIVFCDGCSRDYIATIMDIGETKSIKKTKKPISDFFVMCRIVDEAASATEPPVHITLYQGVPKADKMETIIQKCTEAGVAQIVPLITRRCEPAQIHAAAKKAARYAAIAQSAAEQSMRGVIPVVSSPVKLQDMVRHEMPMHSHSNNPHDIASDKNQDLWLVAYENENTVTIKEALRNALRPEFVSGDVPDRVTNHLSLIKNIGVFIGPEGGFASEEVDYLKSKSAIPITLGPRILRTETAGLVAITQILYDLELH